jgi:hypothetical protein
MDYLGAAVELELEPWEVLDFSDPDELDPFELDEELDDELDDELEESDELDDFSDPDEALSDEEPEPESEPPDGVVDDDAPRLSVL